MTVHLPKDIEASIEAAVQNGRFASVDDAIAAAARLLLREIEREPPTLRAKREANGGLGSIGAMRDAADEIDEIVQDAMKRRREETWRDVSVE